MNDHSAPTENDSLLRGLSSSPEATDTLEEDPQVPKTDPLLPAVTVNPGHRKTYSVDTGAAPHVPPRKRPGTVGVGFGGPKQQPRGHRKQMSSLTYLLQNLEPIREDFAATGHVLRRSFVRHLEELEDGSTTFLDMSMTRSLSVLPDDLAELAEEIGVGTHHGEEVGGDEEQALVEGTTSTGSTGPPIVQYLALILAVVAVSSNSTALKMLDGVAAPLKLYWRMTASYCALSPLAMRHLYFEGIPHLSTSEWLTLAAATFAYSTHACLFVTALEYTTIGNAVIFANSQALLLIVGKACVGEPVHYLEGLGVVVAFAGAMMCSIDSEGAADEAGASTLALVGNALALASAAMGVGYLTFAKAVRSRLPVSLFMFSVLFAGSFMVLLYLALTEPSSVALNMDPFIGVFGWLDLTHGRLPILIFLAVVCNMIGTMGFVRAMEYFDNIVIAVATLMEPLMASLLAYAFHVGILPGPMGWLGNLLVVIGTLAVVYPSLGSGKSLH